MNLGKINRISYFVATIFVTLIAVSIAFAWYTQTSNNADLDSDEIKTVAQGYAGHFSTVENYNATSNVYENEENVITNVSVIPGMVVYYAFIFDVASKDDINSKYEINTLLLYEGEETTYHGVTVGNYNSFLYNTGIEEDSCHIFLMQRKYDSENGYYYEQYGDSYLTTTSTEVSRLSSTNNRNVEANVSMKFNVTMPTVSTVPTNANDDSKVYFMVYIPIWYQDTEENQNEEMNSKLKVVSSIVSAIE